MNWESVRTDVEIYGIRARSTIRLLIQILGVVMVVIGAYNLLTPNLIAGFYRGWFGIAVTSGGRAIYLGDALLMAFGAILAWFA